MFPSQITHPSAQISPQLQTAADVWFSLNEFNSKRATLRLVTKNKVASNSFIHLTAPSGAPVAPFCCRAHALAQNGAITHAEVKDLNFISAKPLVEANPGDKSRAEDREVRAQPRW